MTTTDHRSSPGEAIFWAAGFVLFSLAFSFSRIGPRSFRLILGMIFLLGFISVMREHFSAQHSETRRPTSRIPTSSAVLFGLALPAVVVAVLLEDKSSTRSILLVLALYLVAQPIQTWRQLHSRE